MIGKTIGWTGQILYMRVWKDRRFEAATLIGISALARFRHEQDFK